MCNGPKYFGFDFNGDGDVSFVESCLTYDIIEDIIKNNDENDEFDSFDDFGGDDF